MGGTLGQQLGSERVCSRMVRCQDEKEGILDGRGSRRTRRQRLCGPSCQALGWRKEGAASGCARHAACRGCRTLTPRCTSHGPEAGWPDAAGGLPRFAAPEAAAGGGLGQGRSDRVILARGGAGSRCGAHRSLGRGASAGRGAWPSALSADARAQSGRAGWGLPCGRPAISLSPRVLGDSGPSLSASAKPFLEGLSWKGREDPPRDGGTRCSFLWSQEGVAKTVSRQGRHWRRGKVQTREPLCGEAGASCGPGGAALALIFPEKWVLASSGALFLCNGVVLLSSVE